MQRKGDCLAVELLGSVGAGPPTPFVLLSLLEARSGQDQRPLGHPQGSGHQDILALLAQPRGRPVGIELAHAVLGASVLARCQCCGCRPFLLVQVPLLTFSVAVLDDLLEGGLAERAGLFCACIFESGLHYSVCQNWGLLCLRKSSGLRQKRERG